MNEPIELLRCRFGLTPAEARLALHLAAGETLRSAEAKLSISYETARTHLKNIFHKTGTCRQAELVVLWRERTNLRTGSERLTSVQAPKVWERKCLLQA